MSATMESFFLPIAKQGGRKKWLKAVHQTPFTTAQPRFTQNHHCVSMVHYRQPTLTIRVFRSTLLVGTEGLEPSHPYG